MAQTVKNLPAIQETQVQSLGWEDPLEKGMATHSSILHWRIPWTEEPGRLQFMELQRVRHDRVTNTFRKDTLMEGSSSGYGDLFLSLPYISVHPGAPGAESYRPRLATLFQDPSRSVAPEGSLTFESHCPKERPEVKHCW